MVNDQRLNDHSILNEYSRLKLRASARRNKLRASARRNKQASASELLHFCNTYPAHHPW